MCKNMPFLSNLTKANAIKSFKSTGMKSFAQCHIQPVLNNWVHLWENVYFSIDSSSLELFSPLLKSILHSSQQVHLSF